MRGLRSVFSVIGVAVLVWFLPVVEAEATDVAINAPHSRFTAQVISWSEIRKRSLVRQGWDLSCGAAALSTLMTYYHDTPVSETAITLSLLKNTDPELVRQRGGFSLLDLKRYVTAIGFEGRGYGGMSLHDLDAFSVPAILPVRIREFDHFVVYRGRVADRVLLGDPAFGNITLAIHDFNDMWRSKVAFFVVPAGQGVQLQTGEHGDQMHLLTPHMMELSIPDLNYTRRVIHAIPLIPAVRRTRSFMP